MKFNFSVILIFLVVFSPTLTWTAGPSHLDQAYESIGGWVQKMDCTKNGAESSQKYFQNNPDCLPAGKKSSEYLLSVGHKLQQKTVLQTLSSQEELALICAEKRWQDLLGKPKNDPVILDWVHRVNEQLPRLQELKHKIAQLSTAQLGPARDDKGKPSVAKQKVFNDELLRLHLEYEMRLNQIPMTDHPLMKSFLEKQLSGEKTLPAPLTEADLRSVIPQITQGLKSERRALALANAEGQYDDDLQRKLFSRAESVSYLAKSSPESLATFFSMQCSLEKRKAGEELVSLGTFAASSVLSGGSALLGRAARLSLAAQGVSKSAQLSTWARGLSLMALTTNSVDILQLAINECRKNWTDYNASCKAEREAFAADSQLAKCLLGASMGALHFGGAGYALQSSAKTNAALASKTKKASSLGTKKDEDAYEGFITIRARDNEGIKDQAAQILSTSTASNGETLYLVETRNQKTGQFVTAKLTHEKLKSIGAKPATPSLSIEGIEVEHLDDEEVWFRFFQREQMASSQAGGRVLEKPAQPLTFEDVTQGQKLEIIKTPEPPTRPSASQAAAKEAPTSYLSRLSSNTSPIRYQDDMGMSQMATLEIKGPKQIYEGEYKYPVVIKERTSRTEKEAYLTEKEILKMVPIHLWKR